MKIKYFGWYLLLITIFLFSCGKKRPGNGTENETSKGQNDWLINQRAFPYGKVDYHAYKTAVDFRNVSQTQKKMPGTGNHWQEAGSVNIGGRITDVEMHASDLQTMYLGAASGGVFKSVNAGTTGVAFCV